MPIQLPIGSEDTFKGIIDLVEMNADIYYDDLGKDMRVEEIPADMMELVQEYRTKLIDAVADIDDEIMELALEEQPIPVEKIRAALRQRHHREPAGSRHLRHLLQEQGRAEAARRHRRLHALSSGHPRHQGRGP